MIHPIRYIARRLKQFRRQEDGNATIEFVIVFPVFMMVFLTMFELAIFTIRDVMLEYSLDQTMRDMRLGVWAGRDPDDLRDLMEDSICSRVVAFSDCKGTLLLELSPVPKDAGWPTPDPNATCVDRGEAGKPVVNFQDGPENEMMIVRACIVTDPFLPGTILALKLIEARAGDGYSIVATSGYVNEPREGTS